MIPVSVLVTGKGTVSFKIKGEFNREKPSKFSEVFRPVITWNMTYKCNLLCKHCYINASPKGEEGLSTNEALNLVDQMKELKIPLLIMSGGEPLLRKDFFLIAERASTNGIKLALSTNGTLITKDVAKKLKDLKFSYIGISLDSPYPEWHDYFRGVKGAFNMTVNGIKNALVEGLNVGLRFTITAKNIAHLDDYFKLAESLGVNRITFYHISASGRAKDLDKSWLYTPEQYAKFMDKLIEYAKKYEGKIEIETTLGTFDGIYIASKLAKNEDEFNNFLKFVETTGGCGRKMISIYPNGDVYPCQFIDFIRLGNVRERPLSEILKDIPDLFVNTDKYLEGEKCEKCFFKWACKGGDRARAYYWGGGEKGDDILCPLPYLLNS